MSKNIREMLYRQVNEYIDSTDKEYIDDECFTKDTMERKIKASEHMLDKFTERYKEKYPKLNIEEALLTTFSFVNFSPDYYLSEYRFTWAIAIYILDLFVSHETKKHTLNDLLDVIPSSMAYEYAKIDIKEYYKSLFKDIPFHALYDNTIIHLVNMLFLFRDINYKKDKHTDKDSYILSERTRGVEEIERNNLSQDFRKSYIDILSLIDEEIIESDIKEFEALFWNIADRCMALINEYTSKKTKLEGRIENITLCMRESNGYDKENLYDKFEDLNDKLKMLEDDFLTLKN